MKKIFRIIILVSGAIVIGMAIYFTIVFYPLINFSKAHRDANVPNSDVFDDYLKRDLTKYFSEKLNKNITLVDYLLLKKEATQTGLAFPKYYAWVKIYDDNNLVEEGAVRLAAMEKEYFKVTDYVNKKDMIENPDMLNMIFPNSVILKINEMLSK